MPALLVVMLYLTVWDTSTGTKLYETHAEVEPVTSYGAMEDCRVLGVEMAKKISHYYRYDHPNASTNVNCRWEKRVTFQ